jgi:hypothetical protein
LLECGGDSGVSGVSGALFIMCLRPLAVDCWIIGPVRRAVVRRSALLALCKPPRLRGQAHVSGVFGVLRTPFWFLYFPWDVSKGSQRRAVMGLTVRA